MYEDSRFCQAKSFPTCCSLERKADAELVKALLRKLSLACAVCASRLGYPEVTHLTFPCLVYHSCLGIFCGDWKKMRRIKRAPQVPTFHSLWREPYN